MAEEKISQLEDIVIEIIENEMQREKIKGERKGNQWTVGFIIYKGHNIHVIGVLQVV